MASQTDIHKSNDLTLCSICFEKFKTPRILPCTHAFCHGCISSYIVTSCQSKEAPVGFSCPLCRDFIPLAAAESNPNKWASNFPECKILDMLKKQEKNLCAACLREYEEEEATDICITCEEAICGNCAKYHKRNQTSRHHVVRSLKEPSMVLQSLNSAKKDICPKHSDKKVELHCNDHNIICCSLCASTDHRKCAEVITLQSVAEKNRKEEKVKNLLKSIADYKHRLMKVKENQEHNLEEVNAASDRLSEETRKLRREIKDHLDKLENKQLNELGRVTKQNRNILGKTIDSISDRILLSDHYMKVLSNLQDETDASLVKQYKRVMEGFDALKVNTVQLKEHRIKLESEVLKEANGIKNIKCFSSIKALDTPKNVFVFDTLKFALSVVFEFDVAPYDDINCGVLSNGMLTLAKFGSSKMGLQQFSLDKSTSRQTNEYRSFNCFFGLVMKDNVFYATDRNETCVSIISSDSFELTKTIPVKTDFIPYGVCLWNDIIFIACQTAILKYDIHGRFIESYPVEFNTLFVTATMPGNVVYSNTTKNYAASIDGTGKQLWKYTNPKLHSPHGVDKDEIDNIFVASTKNNSVHILTCDGVLLRIIEDIPNPVFMKVDERNNPQGGKSICDRKVAHTKSNVCTSSDFKNAIMASKMRNVSVRVALPLSKHTSKMQPAVYKLPKITLLNNFNFNQDGNVRVWRQYNIGEGCDVPCKTACTTYELPKLTIIDTYQNKSQFESDGNQADVPVNIQQVESNYSSLLVINDGSQYNSGCSPQLPVNIVAAEDTTVMSVLFSCIVWWHISAITCQIIMLTCQIFMSSCQIRGRTGQKCDPEEVSQEMRRMKDIYGKRRFKEEVFLSSLQIASYFSRLVVKKRQSYNPLYTAEDLQAEAAAHEFQEMKELAASDKEN